LFSADISPLFIPTIWQTIVLMPPRTDAAKSWAIDRLDLTGLHPGSSSSSCAKRVAENGKTTIPLALITANAVQRFQREFKPTI
jgi:hypothetical protein